MAYDEARSDLFTDQVGRFRRWMAARGYRDLPFYMTEVGVLMPPSLGIFAGGRQPVYARGV